jgi:hypothetical protein
MVSSSLDKNIKKALGKDLTSGGVNSSGQAETIREPLVNVNSASAYGGYPADEKLQILFPKCKPRAEHHGPQLSATASLHDTLTADILSIASASSTSSKLSSTIQQQHSNSTNSNLTQANNNCITSKQMKLQSPLSPDHKKIPHHHQYLSSSGTTEQAKLSKLIAAAKHEPSAEQHSYVETNPFRIGGGGGGGGSGSSSNRYFYAQPNPNDLLLFNNNNNSAMPSAAASASATATSSSNSMMHHYHYSNAAAAASSSYYPSSHDRHSYFLEPDEIEHNPYVLDTPTTTALSSSLSNTIPSSILKTTPPDTPPALQPCTTPVDMSPLGSSRNLWDLSPIKSNTPTRIKTQSPSPTIYSRPHRGSYKKLLASPVPIEEDLEMGHYYYNNKKQYYQAPQTDSDSANEPATFNDLHEMEKVKPKSAYFSKSKQQQQQIKHSESSDVIYAEVRKEQRSKEERSKMIKSKSGSGIMG